LRALDALLLCRAAAGRFPRRDDERLEKLLHFDIVGRAFPPDLALFGAAKLLPQRIHPSNQDLPQAFTEFGRICRQLARQFLGCPPERFLNQVRRASFHPQRRIKLPVGHGQQVGAIQFEQCFDLTIDPVSGLDE